MESESDNRVAYIVLWKRLRGLLRNGHSLGDMLNLGQEFHDFVAIGGGASGTALARLDHEWYPIALSHYGSQKALEDELRDSAVALDAIIDELVGLIRGVGSTLGKAAPDWGNSGKAAELLISGVFCESIVKFVGFYEENHFVSASIGGVSDKMPSFRASIHYYQYRFWHLVDQFLIDKDLNRVRKLPGELVEYSPNRRALLRETIPAALERASKSVWRNCPALSQESPLSALSGYLDGAT